MKNKTETHLEEIAMEIYATPTHVPAIAKCIESERYEKMDREKIVLFLKSKE